MILQSGECIRSRTLQGKKRASRKERRGEEERRREEGGGEVEGNILQHLYSTDSLYDR